MLAFGRVDFGPVAVFAGQVGREEGEAAAEDQEDDDRAGHHPARRDGDAVADPFPEAVADVGDVLAAEAADLVGGEDPAVERQCEQRRDPLATERSKQPVEQNEQQHRRHQNQNTGEGDEEKCADSRAIDDPSAGPVGDRLRLWGRLRRVRDEGPEGAAAEDRQQRRQQGQHRERRAGDPDRGNRAEPGGAVDLGQHQAEQRRDHRRRRGEDRRPGGGQGRLHRLVAVGRVVQLLAVAGDQQQRVVGAGAEDEDRHDRARLAVDRHPQLGDAVADRAREGLGEEHRGERDEEEHRRAVDDDQEEDHQADRGQQQGAVDPFEDFDRVGREPGAAGDLDFEAAAGVADLFAPVLDRVEDPFALAVALDVGADDRRLAVFGADRADEGGVVGRLAGDRRSRASATGRVAGFGAGTATTAGCCRAVGDDAREALLGHLGDVRFDRLLVGHGEAVGAAVDDHRGGEFAVLEFLGGVQRLGRFGAAGQVGGGLVAFGVFELAGQVGGSGRNEDRDEPDGEDDPLGLAASGEGEP